jgi:hypothetical protein
VKKKTPVKNTKTTKRRFLKQTSVLSQFSNTIKIDLRNKPLLKNGKQTKNNQNKRRDVKYNKNVKKSNFNHLETTTMPVAVNEKKKLLKWNLN